MRIELEKLYRETNLGIFVMAVNYVVDNGVKNIEKLSEQKIKEFDGNSIMTKEFVQMLARLGRDIAKACDSPSELIQFCQSKDLFDTYHYDNTPNKTRLEELATKSLHSLYEAQTFGIEEWDEYVKAFDLEDDELKFFELPERKEEE